MESTPLKILTVEEIKKKSTSEISELKKSIEEDIKNKFKYLSTVIEHGISNKYLIYEKYIDELHNESDEDSDELHNESDEDADEDSYTFRVWASAVGQGADCEIMYFDNFEDALYCAKKYKRYYLCDGSTVGFILIYHKSDDNEIWEWQEDWERIRDYDYVSVNLLNNMVNNEVETIYDIFDNIDEHIYGVEKSREKYKLKLEKQTLSNVLDKKIPLGTKQDINEILNSVGYAE